ncbi:hypothetical protein NQ315_001048 [Exocentrus adspersus]|uniref:APCDD1 domain-containing protein n=1 Tax=Exocentrus adspersus TaxID=1586481 RepID=A0AAV8WF90_9CUCU|nr:hypothetical protein NQ315_001048 [Exocentrus adspersus]
MKPLLLLLPTLSQHAHRHFKRRININVHVAGINISRVGILRQVLNGTARFLKRNTNNILESFPLSVVFLFTFSATHVDSGASKCEKLASSAALEDHKTVVETSLRLLAGTWISEGCETRPGPEFVIRSYTFDKDGRYFLIQHHYWDDSCSSPQLSVLSHGRIQLRNSLIQPGAASGIIKLTNITIIPQDNNAAKELDKVVSTECPGQYWKSWRRYEEHTVYDSRFEDKKKVYNLWTSTYEQSMNTRGSNVHFSDISCMGSLKWAFNELKLLKIQLRPILDEQKRKNKYMKMELLLGDIHSNFRLREIYNPTSFQVALVKQAKDEVVYINRHAYLIKSLNNVPMNIFTNGKAPPHLIEKPHLPPYIWGEWTSTRCEVRPMGLFLTRRFVFYSEDSTWTADHKFYSDPFCKIPKFQVTASGRFALQGPNKELKASTDIDFYIEQASLNVFEQKMINDMRLPGLCGEGEWEVDVAKDLAPTKGCPQLGIALPSQLNDIVKVEMDYKGSILLFLGQVETDSLHTTSTERPTAFQLPLIKCGEVSNYSQGLQDILTSGMYHSSSCRFRLNGFVVVLVSCIFVLLR